MSGDDKDDEGAAFRLYLDVPDESDSDQEPAIAWLNQLAAQLAAADGKKLAIKVTGTYDDEDYPSDDGGSREQDTAVADESGTAEAKTYSQAACSSKTAVVNIMVCPGRRPYT
jgi:hypothetical protein